jgi:site-specific DNA-methyltransferase (cytosine-N4-specific)
LTQPGETVLDPFCGSGTTLVEALRLRRNAVGVDISPLAVLISRVKCTPLGDEDRQAIRGYIAWAKTLVSSFYNQKRLGDGGPGQLLLDIRDHWLKFGIERPAVIPDLTAMSQLAEWFPREPIYELSLIRDVLEQCPLQAAKDFGMVAISSIIQSVSFQRSETRPTKVYRQVRPLETLSRWTRKVEDMLDRLSDLQPVTGLCSVRVHQGDARDLDFLKRCPVSLVLTSPPYPNTFDYRSHQRLRLMWLGLENPMSSRYEIGSHRAYSRKKDALGEVDYEREMGAVLASLKEILRPGGVCVFIVGPSRIRGKHSDNEGCVLRAARGCGFRVMASIGDGVVSTLGSVHRGRGSGGGLERAILLCRE